MPTTHKKATPHKTTRKWSAEVTENSDALDLKKNIFVRHPTEDNKNVLWLSVWIQSLPKLLWLGNFRQLP